MKLYNSWNWFWFLWSCEYGYQIMKLLTTCSDIRWKFKSNKVSIQWSWFMIPMKLVELIAKLVCKIMNLSLHLCEFILQKSSFTSNATAVRHGLGCSMNKHSIHSGLLRRPEFFFFFYKRVSYSWSLAVWYKSWLFPSWLKPRWKLKLVTMLVQKNYVLKVLTVSTVTLALGL
jgi:hypothetical protein